MKPEAWDRVKDLFHKAMRGDRASVLRDVEAEVRAEVEELLRAHDAVPEEATSEEAGTIVGRYKLLQQIGEGGFGTVWMAEQSEPVRRKVALKILKPGMETGQVVARFEAERQALALMDHLNIARVFDGGATAAGRPYFVMELVRGVPITGYCDEAKLPAKARLELFVQVCGAVQHAHQKGIIHRDLKPSNILVTLHDGVPVPKVIDFGIAKALDRPLTDKTMFTEFRQMIGTPEYMAPEQAEMSGLDVDTRADIYSLGVLLYELLTGTKPFDLRAILEQGYEAMVRTIREVDPPRPSTRVSTLGERALQVADRRRTAPQQLGRALKGDLDWIVMKALEKDRARRYETANGLAMDVMRHLQDEPVLATPASAAYRTRKFVRKHRVGVAAASVVAIALLASGALAYTGMGEAERETEAARRAEAAAHERRDEARRAQAAEREQRARADQGTAEAQRETLRSYTISALIDEMLGSASPHAKRSENHTVRRLLDEFDRGLPARVKDQADVEATLRVTIGRAYLGLGLLEPAERQIALALETARRLFPENDPRTCPALLAQAALRRAQGRDGDEEKLLRSCLAILEAAEPAGWKRRHVEALLGSNLARQGRREEAERLLLDACEKLEPPPHLRRLRSDAEQALIELYEAWGKPDLAAARRGR